MAPDKPFNKISHQLNCANTLCRKFECELDTPLKKCSGCGYVSYCSTVCQRTHWPQHRQTCKFIQSGKEQGQALEDILVNLSVKDKPQWTACLINADTVSTEAKPPPPKTYNLQHVWPTFTGLMYSLVYTADWPYNYRLRNKVRVAGHHLSAMVLDFGNPNNRNPVPAHFPLATNGYYLNWWPSAPGLMPAAHLGRRVATAAYCAEKSLGLVLALRRLFDSPSSFKYYDKKIVDFGVARGRVQIDQSDYLMENRKHIQDPNRHYWIYFVTEQNESVYLDPFLLVYRMQAAAPTKPYLPPEMRMEGCAPGMLFGRQTTKMLIPKMHFEIQTKPSRFSAANMDKVPDIENPKDADRTVVGQMLESLYLDKLSPEDLRSSIQAVLATGKHADKACRYLQTLETKNWPESPFALMDTTDEVDFGSVP